MIETESTAVIGPPGERRGGPRPEDADAGPVDAWGVPEFDQETIIRPRPGWIAINWQEMWDSASCSCSWSARHLGTIQADRTGPRLGDVAAADDDADLLVHLGRFVKIPSDGFPYPVFVFAGLIPWTLFSQGMSASAQSLINQQHLLTKVYFPRLFVPIASAGVFLVDLLIALGIYGLIHYYGVAPSWGSSGCP